MQGHVIVIGGGVGGLSAAIRLAASGRCRVTLLEKNSRVGGKLNLWETPHPNRPGERPFRFDTGPSLLTLPFVFDALFQAAGRRLADYLKLIRLDPIARFTWPDGTSFELRANQVDLERELTRISPNDVQGWRRFAARGQRIWDTSAELFLFHAPGQLITGKVGQTFLSVLDLLLIPFRIGMFLNYGRCVNREVQSQKLRDVLYQYATYSGSSPLKAPATLAVIPHAELHFGGWHIEGGMYRLADALERLTRELGVEVCTSCPVASLLVEKKVTSTFFREGGCRLFRGVQLSDGSKLTADAVVANSDVIYSYRELIDPAHRHHFSDRKLARLDPGGSGIVLMLGVDGTYPQLAHHNKFMPPDYRKDLRAMFDTRRIPDDPCIYVCASTRSDPSLAPHGCENLFVLASAPPLDGRIDWNTEGPRYATKLIRTLQTRWNLHDLEKRIVVQRIITPLDLQTLYNANAGSIYGLGSNSRRAAFLRPPNRDRRIRGLYFAGGATHPGGGLPLVALSGKIASELVLEDFG